MKCNRSHKWWLMIGLLRKWVGVGWSECVSSFKAPPSQNGSRVIWLFYGAWVLGILLFILKWRTFLKDAECLACHFGAKWSIRFSREEKRKNTGKRNDDFAEIVTIPAPPPAMFLSSNSWWENHEVFQVPPQIHDHSLGMWCLLMASKNRQDHAPPHFIWRF